MSGHHRARTTGLRILLKSRSANMDACRLLQSIAMHLRHHRMRDEASHSILVLLHEVPLQMVLLGPLALRLCQSLLLIDLLSIVW